MKIRKVYLKKKWIFLLLILFVFFNAILLLYFNNSNGIKFYIDDDISKLVYNLDISDIYNLEKQDLIEKEIDKLKKSNDYSFNKPLLIMNPYGTNMTGLYIYFESDKATAIEYTISVDDTDIPDYSNMLVGDFTKVHEGQIIGLVQGHKNTIVLKMLDDDLDVMREKTIVLDLPIYDNNVIEKINIKDYGYDNVTEEGLIYNSLALYDNNGVLRVSFNKNYFKNFIQFTDEGDLLFLTKSDTKEIIRINKYGKIIDIYEDNSLDDEDNKLEKYDFKNIWFGTLKGYINYGEKVESSNNNRIKVSNGGLYKYNPNSGILLGLNIEETYDFMYYDTMYFDIYNYDKKELFIPSEVDGIKIKKISGFHLSGVEVIKIEDGIEEIADYCFLGANDLKKVYVPSSVKKIGKDIFGLNEVEIIKY